MGEKITDFNGLAKQRKYFEKKLLLLLSITSLLSNLRGTTSECVYFRSRDKDGGDTV